MQRQRWEVDTAAIGNKRSQEESGSLWICWWKDGSARSLRVFTGTVAPGVAEGQVCVSEVELDLEKSLGK